MKMEAGDVSYEKLNLSRSKQKWSETASKHFKKLKLRDESSSSRIFCSKKLSWSFIDLPWDDLSVDNFDLKRILDRDHYGLKDVKMIIEHLAVS